MQREKKSIVTLLSTVYSHAKHLIIFSSPIWRLRWTPQTEIWPRRSLSWGLSCGPSQCRTSSPNMPRLRGRSSSSQKSERNFVSCDCVPFFVFLEFLKRWEKVHISVSKKIQMVYTEQFTKITIFTELLHDIINILEYVDIRFWHTVCTEYSPVEIIKI